MALRRGCAECIPAAKQREGGTGGHRPCPSAYHALQAVDVIHVRAQQGVGGRDFGLAKGRIVPPPTNPPSLSLPPPTPAIT